jgi:SWI/SNF-related matrix-associated actin-dependent regulator 1 of chromatin subfamily A
MAAKLALTNASFAALELEMLAHMSAVSEDAASEVALAETRTALEAAAKEEAAAASVAIAHAAALAMELEMLSFKEKASAEVARARSEAAAEIAAANVKTAAEVAIARSEAAAAELELMSEASAVKARAEAEIAAAKEAAEAEIAVARAARAAAELELEYAKMTVEALDAALATSKEEAAALGRRSRSAAAALGYKTEDATSIEEVVALMKAIELELVDSGAADDSEQIRLVEESEGLPDFSGRVDEGEDNEVEDEEEFDIEEAEMLTLLHRCFIAALQADEDGDDTESDDGHVRDSSADFASVLGRAFRRVSTIQSGSVTNTGAEKELEAVDAAGEVPPRALAEQSAAVREWVGRSRCAGCLKQGHQTWYPKPPPDQLRVRLEPGRADCGYLCNACDQTNKLQLARERERERTAADPLMRTPVRKKGELPKMSVREPPHKKQTSQTLSPLGAWLLLFPRR